MTNHADSLAALDDAAARQAMSERAVRALVGARSRLILGRNAASVFFACLLLRLKCEPDESVGTMATDGRVLAYAPTFVAGLPADELVGVLAHEALHCALAHPARRAGRNAGKWNVACDLAVNPLLTAAGFALPEGRLMPGEGAYADLPAGLPAKAYYARLPDADDGTGENDGSADGGGDVCQGDPGGCGGVRDPGDGDPAAAAATAADWQAAVVQAEQQARGRGDLPGGLARSVGDVVHPPADWRAALRAFVAATARTDYSWVRPNRRLVWQGVYLPGLRGDELGDVVLAVDTSGSVGARELGVFAREAEAVLAAYDCTLTVVYHDTHVRGVEAWASSDGPLTLTPVGGGGTSHVGVFDWLDRSGLTPACVVCLTDLDTRFPAAPPAVPVVWAAVGGGTTMPPFGLRVDIPD